MSKNYVNFETDNSLSKYFKDVRKSILITPKKEVVLAKRIQNGDLKAIDELVEANLKFVVSIAKDYQNQGLPLADLISEGNYGLIKAASRFDHTRSFRFISYAVWWIKQAIILGLNENARTVRLPANVINKLYHLKREIERFEFENEREPIYGEILDSNNEAVELLVYPKCSSLNHIINEDGDEIIDVIVIKEDKPDFIIDDRVKDEISKTLEILDERERNIIESYYGINTNCEPMTLEAIGERYSLTKERIRQIKEKSLRKLRHNAHNLFSVIND
jgi:RNA polymerase primary sigma factor